MRLGECMLLNFDLATNLSNFNGQALGLGAHRMFSYLISVLERSYKHHLAHLSCVEPNYYYVRLAYYYYVRLT